MINRERCKISSRLITGFIFIQYAWPIAALIIYMNTSGECDVHIQTWTSLFITLSFIFQTATLIERCTGNYSQNYGNGLICVTLILWISACILYADANKTHICEKTVPDFYHFMEAFVFAIPIMIIIFLMCIIMTYNYTHTIG